MYYTGTQGREGVLSLEISNEQHLALGSPGDSVVKHLPTVQKTQVQFLSQEDPGGGHGNLLQYSCLENPMGREAWRATVYSVTQSQT